MNITYLLLKKVLPELNRCVITVERILQVFCQRNIEYYEIPLEGDGAFVTKDGNNYVFLRSALTQLLKHETILHEGCHALIHYPAPFLLRRHQLQADIFSLIGIMPLADLKHINRLKHQLEPESFELLKRRNEVNRRWKL